MLSGGGKFNYFGTKGLLEEQLEDSPLLPSADYTLCLDSLLKQDDAEGLYVHVSKPPKEGSKAYSLVQALNQVRRAMCMLLQLCCMCMYVHILIRSLTSDYVTGDPLPDEYSPAPHFFPLMSM